MKFIHTADWHLGRLFHNVHLTEDQAHVLDQLVELVEDVRPDAVLVAGDIYDRAVPPPEAVALLSETLDRIVRGAGVPVLLIAGNHDSPARLGFAAPLLAEGRLYVAGPVDGPPLVVPLGDDGALVVHAVPYADPAEVRAACGDDTVHDHEAALRAQLARARALTPAGALSVAVAHAFVVGGAVSESERPLSVGGSGQVPADLFAGFDYVALGHLHRPQRVAGETVRYAGSLLKYSFSEHDHAKSVAVVEIAPDAGGGRRRGRRGASAGAPALFPTDAGIQVRAHEVGLEPRRDVRRVEGLLSDLVAQGRDDRHGDDYIEAWVLDKGAVLEPMARLREVYPNVLAVRRPEVEAGPARSQAPDIRRLSECELFASFFGHVTGDELADDEAQRFVAVVDDLRRREREALA